MTLTEKPARKRRTRKATKATKATKRKPQAAHVPRVRRPQVGPVSVDSVVHFSPYDLARYEAAQGRVANALQAVLLKKAEVEQKRREFQDWLVRAQAELVSLQQDANAKQAAMKALQTECEGLYELDFASVTYDDLTGRLFVNGETIPAREVKEKVQDGAT